jgi:hypothetical protein
MIFAAAYLALALATAFWLRHRWAFFQRLNDLNWQALLLIDIAAAFLIFWPLYLVAILRDRPLPWATISAICGCYTLKGRKWAEKASVAIDALFFVLTSQKHHCAEAYLSWSAPLARR